MNPIYPNCFDLLTTHGIVADDVVGYITGTPSPYLQNYVAQRTAAPEVPGHIMPSQLPNLPHRGEVYGPQQDTFHHEPKPDVPPAPQKKKGWETAKKIAAGALIIGLSALGIFKGKALYNKFFKSGSAASGTPWYKRAGQWIQTKFNAAKNWVASKASAVGSWFKNAFSHKPSP